jgi:hypothetical protein
MGCVHRGWGMGHGAWGAGYGVFVIGYEEALGASSLYHVDTWDVDT